MASSETEKFEFYEKNMQYIERLVYDVLVYTLSKCGFPENNLPTTDHEANSYNLPNYVESAGLMVLTTALSKREEYKQMFTSRHKSYGFNDEGIKQYIQKLIMCHKNEALLTRYYITESALAVSNEIMLFFYHEKIDIDFNKLIISISETIIVTFIPGQDVPKEVEDLYVDFDDISVYKLWINYFITKCAVPYGSRNDVTEVLKKHFGLLWTAQIGKKGSRLGIQIKRIMDSWKFISVDVLIEAIKNREGSSEILALGLIVLPSDIESPNSENCKNDPNVSSKILPLGIVVPRIKESPCSENSENDLESLSKILQLGQIIVPCVGESSGFENSKNYLEALSEILPLGLAIVPCDNESPGSESSKNDLEALSKIFPFGLFVVPRVEESRDSENSKNDLLVGRKTYKKDSTTPSNVSDQSEQRNKLSSELGIEDDMKAIHLDVKGACKENRDGSPKRKTR